MSRIVATHETYLPAEHASAHPAIQDGVQRSLHMVPRKDAMPAVLTPLHIGQGNTRHRADKAAVNQCMRKEHAHTCNTAIRQAKGEMLLTQSAASGRLLAFHGPIHVSHPRVQRIAASNQPTSAACFIRDGVACQLSTGPNRRHAQTCS